MHKKRDFNKIKENIQALFQGRSGFDESVIEAISATYLFLQEKYPNPINNSEIPDIDNFVSIPENNQITLANVYINRLLNNVQSIEYAEGSVYDPEEKCVRLEKDISLRLQVWNNKTLNDEERQIIADKIRAKLIVHELIHAASDNGFMTGFNATYGNNASKKKEEIVEQNTLKYPDKEAWSYQLEEAITEILALNIVGNNNLAVLENYNGFINCRNPESSNSNLNAFAEYFLRVYPDCVKGKFTNGLLWSNEFEQTYLTQWGLKSENKSPMRNLEDYLAQITNKTPKINQINTLAYFQQAMLTDYMSNLQIQDVSQLEDVIKSYAAFRIFAVKDVENKVDEGLQNCLNSIKTSIISYATKLGLSKDELNQILIAEDKRLKSNDGQKEIFENAYGELKAEKEVEYVM